MIYYYRGGHEMVIMVLRDDHDRVSFYVILIGKNV